MAGWTTIFVRSTICLDYCVAECGGDTRRGFTPLPLIKCTSVLILMIWCGLASCLVF